MSRPGRARAGSVVAVVILVLLAAPGCGGDDRPPGAVGGIRSPAAGSDGAPTGSAASATGTASPGDPGGGSPLVGFTVGECLVVDGLRASTPVDPAATRPADCAAPHTAEVFSVPSLPATPRSPYPGATAVDAFAADQCLSQFVGYVGAPYDRSALDLVTVEPTSRSWAAGDRTVACLLYDQDFVPLPGPVRGSGR